MATSSPGLDAWQRWRQARAALRELSHLSSWQLRDLGINRSELFSIALRPGDATRIRVHRHL